MFNRRVICVLLTVIFIICTCGCSERSENQIKNEQNSAVANDPVGIRVEGSTDLPGNFYLSFVNSRSLIMLDGKGNIVWSKHEDQPSGASKTGLWDFKKHNINGETYYSYHEDQTGRYDDYGMEGFAPGERVIVDKNFNEVKRIRLEESNFTKKGDPLDGHDFLMIDLDHYILSAYIKETVYNIPGYPGGSSVLCSYLQEVDHGKVVWDFKSTNYSELYELTTNEGQDNANDFANKSTDVPDYVHFNAMRLDKCGNLVCSFRHMSTVVCLDRNKRDSDQILWKLSGNGDEFGLKGDGKTSCQHYVTVDGDNISVFDNGNSRGYTRIDSFPIDVENKKVGPSCYYSFYDKFSAACGSAQRIHDEVYAISWGRSTKDSECMSVYDLSTGSKLLAVTLNDPSYFTYRCVYYE